MSTPLWKIRRFTTVTVVQALRTAKACHSRGITDADQLCRIVGYIMERMRQGLGGLPVAARINGAILSGHRYARGKNADNYLTVGRRLFAEMSGMVGLYPDTPSYVVIDKLIEEGHL